MKKVTPQHRRQRALTRSIMKQIRLINTEFDGADKPLTEMDVSQVGNTRDAHPDEMQYLCDLLKRVRKIAPDIWVTDRPFNHLFTHDSLTH